MLDLPHALQPKASAGAFDDCDAADDRRFALVVREQAVPACFVERIGVDQAQSHIEAWADLGTRALESNVFLDPAFALPAARHVCGRKRPSFLLVWQGDAIAPRKRLIALWPIAPPRQWGTTVETWVHDYCCSGAPLLDRADALAALDAIAAFLRELNSAAPMLSAARLRENGPTLAVLRRFATSKALPFKVVAHYDRAAIDMTRTRLGAPVFASPRKNKELRRQARRLQEKGPIAMGVARDGAELIRQIEAFLILEAKGWKGRHGGAFLNQPEHVAFLKTMAHAMSRGSKCRIYWMSVADKLIASNIVLFGDTSAYFWKTAYDEDFASASPGVLLTMSMTEALMREPGLLAVDSCAVSGHPMIDHLWPDRVAVADVILSLRSDKVRAFEAVARRERWRRLLREKAKSAWVRFGPA